MPVTEKRGRRHSSEVVVITLDDTGPTRVKVNKADVRVDTYRDTGPGGQHRNKTELKDVDISFTRDTGPGGQNRNKRETTVVAQHRPTGMVVRVSEERTQGRNREIALSRLAERLAAAQASEAAQSLNRGRSSQMSDQERKFTWTEWRDEVTTSSGHRASYSRALRGNLGPLLR